MTARVATTAYTLPPGPTGFPLVGNLPQFQRDPLAFIEGVHRAYGPIATVHMLNQPVVFTFRPEHAYDLLVERARSVGVGERPGLRMRLGRRCSPPMARRTGGSGGLSSQPFTASAWRATPRS